MIAFPKFHSLERSGTASQPHGKVFTSHFKIISVPDVYKHYLVVKCQCAFALKYATECKSIKLQQRETAEIAMLVVTAACHTYNLALSDNSHSMVFFLVLNTLPDLHPHSLNFPSGHLL